MKKPLIILPFICLLLFVIVSFGSHPHKKSVEKMALPGKGFAIVELFTSEGCSSCPPADDAVAAIEKEYPSNVFVLGFHVDYWNYLGWKDEFSDAGYSNRQKDYAAVFQLESIYTPQVIVNGKTQFTGSDKDKLNSSVQQALNTANTFIELSAKAANAKNVLVTCKAKLDSKNRLCVALVQLSATSVVKKGENKGKQLHHINVVRSFEILDNNTGEVKLNVPAGLEAKDCRVIAFVQNKNDMHIAAAGECGIK